MTKAAQIIKISRDKGWLTEVREPAESAVIMKPKKRKLPSRLMSVSEVASRLGCHVWSVYELIRLGEIEWQPIGRRSKRISEDALLDYLERKAAERGNRRS